MKTLMNVVAIIQRHQPPNPCRHHGHCDCVPTAPLGIFLTVLLIGTAISLAIYYIKKSKT